MNRIRLVGSWSRGPLPCCLNFFASCRQGYWFALVNTRWTAFEKHRERWSLVAPVTWRGHEHGDGSDEHEQHEPEQDVGSPRRHPVLSKQQDAPECAHKRQRLVEANNQNLRKTFIIQKKSCKLFCYRYCCKKKSSHCEDSGTLNLDGINLNSGQGQAGRHAWTASAAA